MIYYYSGTGNTRYCASVLARALGEETRFIPAKGETPLPEAWAAVGFMFPIYSWGVPPIVLDFIESLPAESLEGRYVWAACTCGDEAGTAMRVLRSHLECKGAEVAALFSIIMPNDYVLLPGFSVDPQEVEQRKLAEAPQRLGMIARAIGERRTGIYDVHEGSVPRLRSLVWPLFKRWGVNPRRWHADAAKCVGCSLCVSACPVGNVSLDEERHPVWGNRCLSCCACFHTCPQRAIDYGHFTSGKGNISAR